MERHVIGIFLQNIKVLEVDLHGLTKPAIL